MSEHNLTKNAYRALCLIYKAFLNRTKQGVSRRSAILFLDYSIFKDENLYNSNTTDFRAALNELKRARYIDLYVDDGFKLLDSGIALMENRFKDGLSEVIDFITKIPFH